MLNQLLYLNKHSTVAIIGEDAACDCVAGLLAESSGLPVYTADEDFDPHDVEIIATILAWGEGEGYIVSGTLGECMLDNAARLPMRPVSIIIDLRSQVEPGNEYMPLDNLSPAIWIHGSSEHLAQLIGGGPGGQSSSDSST